MPPGNLCLIRKAIVKMLIQVYAAMMDKQVVNNNIWFQYKIPYGVPI